MTDIDTSEPSRTVVDIEPIANPLGMAVAHFVLMFNDAPGRYAIMKQKTRLKAQVVENDPMFGDHVKIFGTFEEGEDVGADTTRYVVINHAPKGVTQLPTRFVNFNRVEHSPNYHIGQINQLVQDTIGWIVSD